MALKPYKLDEAKSLVEDAIIRMEQTHARWDTLERMYATGSVGSFSNTAAGIDRYFADVLHTLDSEMIENVNILLPNINIIVESIIERRPQFVLEPLDMAYGSDGKGEQDAAKAAETGVQYWFKRARGHEAMRLCAWDLVKLGSAFIKVGWNYAEGTVDRDLEEVTAEIENMVAESATQITSTDASDYTSTEQTIVLLDEPFVEYVKPHDIFVPHDCRDLRTTRWVAQRITKPVDELRSDLNIPDSVDLHTDDIRSNRSQFRDKSNTTKGVFQFATVYEFYDLRTHRLLVFQRDSKKALIDTDIPYSTRRSPFIHARNNQLNADDFYGFGDLENIAPLQTLYTEVWTNRMDNMRRSGTMLLADASAFDEQARDGLEDMQNGQVIIVDGQNAPLADKLFPVSLPAISNDVYNAGNDIQGAVSSTLGLSDFQQGGSGADRMSGTAASAVEGHSTLRGAGKQQALTNMASQIGETILELCGEFMQDPIAVKVSGDDGILMKMVTPDHLAGDYLVSVEAGSMAAVNPVTRERRAIERLNTVVPALVNNGYEPEPVLRATMRDLGYDPDVVLKKTPPVQEQAPIPEPGMQAPVPTGDSFTGPGTGDTGPHMDVGGLAATAAEAGTIGL